MAPNVKVPTNFGRHHIGSRSHSNLALKLKEGKVIHASSLILSFNSSVIEHLTTELEQSSLDMDDFQEPAVQCFIVASYIGELEDINKNIFRDVNKMAHVFDVSWLVERCVEYFKGLSETGFGESYEDMFYLFEEARFVLDILKKRDLIDVVFQKINLTNKKEGFVSRYMEDFDNLSKKQLDLMLELAGNDVQIVVQPLTCHLTELINIQGAIFTENSRHLLENSKLSNCRQNDRFLYEDLFDILQRVENISCDDLKFVLRLRRESDQDKRRCLVNVNNNNKTTPISTKIPNLFHSLEKFKDLLTFDELICSLADSVKVKNMMMFAEGLYLWLRHNKSAPVLYSAELMNKIVAVKQERKWNSIPKQYFKFLTYSNRITEFCEGLEKCDELFKLNDTGRSMQVINCHNQLQITGEILFEQDNKFMFHFKHPDGPICTREGTCGFIIKTIPLSKDKPDEFDMQLCTDHSEYPAEIHFHDEELCAENMHVMVGGVYSDDRDGSGEKYWHSFPVSWSGKPFFNNHESSKFTWGPVTFNNNTRFRLKVLYDV